MSSVRSFVPSDAPGVAAVQVRNYRHDYAPLCPPGFWDGVGVEEQTGDWMTWLTDHPADVLLVARDGREVVGYVLARVHPFHGADAEVLALHVRPESRGHGHGAALLRAAVEALRGRGARSVGLGTLEGNPVRAWYAALGGQEVAVVEQDADGWPLREVVFVWPDTDALLDALR
ncbi:ribosomal protein S18 acetylase RimI-like enzyme [Deinococcus metalli]|uniref:Ribosomal protein S18 acetylase RimI-like enzyme n=1 Tax=Deinococcus metalli TaxID=1141878 RepID=A0A7W8NUE9_9DEIO|nr:GNAT family N-acetyltransferase [Deinococcus metalli]MBB5379252.1 ribosomal protein S18 acetylase RimI-like enzyme [Deinococcus metalli]GHF65735.1 hypothetical protein GCM10017781_46830 [Deinococcus metalli]